MLPPVGYEDIGRLVDALTAVSAVASAITVAVSVAVSAAVTVVSDLLRLCVLARRACAWAPSMLVSPGKRVCIHLSVNM